MARTHAVSLESDFAESVSGNAPGPVGFFASPVHEEALARLQFLADQHQRLGLLVGPSGSGKSLLLDQFARELTRSGAAAAVVNLLGVEPAEMLCRLGARLGLWLEPSQTPAVLWRRLDDRLAEFHYERRPVVLLLDDVPEAAPAVQQQVVRLALAQPSGARSARQTAGQTAHEVLSLVVAGRDDQLGRLHPRLLELAELRIELEPWQEEDTSRFVASRVQHAAGEAAVFEPSALARLHELSGGIPRRVSRLAELALVACRGQQLKRIDETVIEAVHRELSPSGA